MDLHFAGEVPNYIFPFTEVHEELEHELPSSGLWGLISNTIS